MRLPDGDVSIYIMFLLKYPLGGDTNLLSTEQCIINYLFLLWTYALIYKLLVQWTYGCKRSVLWNHNDPAYLYLYANAPVSGGKSAQFNGAKPVWRWWQVLVPCYREHVIKIIKLGDNRCIMCNRGLAIRHNRPPKGHRVRSHNLVRHCARCSLYSTCQLPERYFNWSQFYLIMFMNYVFNNVYFEQINSEQCNTLQYINDDNDYDYVDVWLCRCDSFQPVRRLRCATIS